MNTVKRRLRFSSLICSLVLALSTASAMAYSPYGLVSDFTTTPEDGSPGITYYDIYDGATTGRGDLTEQLRFYFDVVNKRNNRTNWSYLAYEILKNGGGESAYWDHDGKGFNGEFGAGGDYVDLISQWGSTLKVATSFDELEFAARARVSDYFVHNGKREVGTSEIDGIELWQDDTTPRTIFYTDAFHADNDAGQRYYNYFGLAFYDFKLAMLADEDLHYSTAADDYDSIEEAVAGGAPGVSYVMTPGSQDGFVTGVKNDTTLTTTATQTMSSTDTTTISNAITKSEQYSWDVMVGAELAFGYDAPAPTGGAEWSFKIYSEFTKGEVYSSAYQDTTSNTHSVTNTSSVAVPLPPHTAVLMDQSDVTMKATVNYDSPIIVTYRVAVYSLIGHKYWDGLFTHINYKDGTYLATFGKDNGSGLDANENLATRLRNYELLANYETVYGDGLNWNAIYFANSTTEASRVTTAVDWLKASRAMSVTGARLTYDYEGFESKVSGVQPIYPLRHVVPAYSEFGMGYGTHKYVLDIPISGKDASWTPYHGFDARYGHWILVDLAGNPVATSPIASLTTDPVSGATILTAGEVSGSIYLKYVIDEDRYSFGAGQFFTSNDELTSTAFIKLTVVPSIVGDPRPDVELDRGASATGSGWYLLDDQSRVDFSFTVAQVPKTADNPEYKGQVVLVNDGKWRLKGDLNLLLTKAPLAKAYGIGSLQRWDASLQNGKGGWVKVDDHVTFRIGFEDGDFASEDKGTPGTMDAFAVQIDHGVPAGGPSLPNSYLTLLGGGNVKLKG